MAEKVTPTFVIKLIVLFALLLVGVFMRPAKIVKASDVKSASSLEQRTSIDQDNLETKNSEYKLVRQDKSSTL